MNRALSLLVVVVLGVFLSLVTVFEECIDKVYSRTVLKSSVYDPQRPAGQRWHSQEARARLP